MTQVPARRGRRQGARREANAHQEPTRRNVPTPELDYSQDLRRMSNDGRRDIFALTQRHIAFVCECTRSSCFETVALTVEEFDGLREQEEPILAAGHREAAPKVAQ